MSLQSIANIGNTCRAARPTPDMLAQRRRSSSEGRHTKMSALVDSEAILDHINLSRIESSPRKLAVSMIRVPVSGVGLRTWLKALEKAVALKALDRLMKWRTPS